MLVSRAGGKTNHCQDTDLKAPLEQKTADSSLYIFSKWVEESFS